MHQTVDATFSWKNSLVFCSGCEPSPPLSRLRGTGQWSGHAGSADRQEPVGSRRGRRQSDSTT